MRGARERADLMTEHVPTSSTFDAATDDAHRELGSATTPEPVASGPGQSNPYAGLSDQPIDAEDFVALKRADRRMLLAPWLPAAGLAMVYASKGVGKTHFALGVAHAVASGGHFLRWQAPAPNEVLYVDGEMSLHDLQDRVSPLVPTLPIKKNLKILAGDQLPNGVPDISTDDGQAWLLDRVGGAELIILDNLSALSSTGDENAAESWTPLKKLLLNLRRHGRAVLLVHHAGKMGDQRGTSHRADQMNTVIKLEHPKGYDSSEGARFNVIFEKNRGFFGSSAQKFEAKLNSDTGIWEVSTGTNPKMDKILELQGQGMNQSEIARALGIHKSTVSRLVTGSGSATI